MIDFSLNGDVALSQENRLNLIEFSDNLIRGLTPAAIKELLSGYENDHELLLNSILKEAREVIEIYPRKAEIQSTLGLEEMYLCFDETLSVENLNYFKATKLPNFILGWRNLEWSNLYQKYNRLCIKASRGSGKSYDFVIADTLWDLYGYITPTLMQGKDIRNKNKRDTVIITNESKLGKIHLAAITAEIRSNDLLHDKLLPTSLLDLGKEQIRTKNGANVMLRSKGSSAIRGLHVGKVKLDDFLDKSVIYSQEQRDKFLEVFNAEIKPIVNPGGSLTVSGTPFSADDLYEHITQHDDTFKTFTYPVIYPNGKILSPDRYSLEDILAYKQSQGSIVFSREFLCVPISDASTLFPWEWLKTSYIKMDDVKLVDNIDSYKIKNLERVVVGCDLAKSANIGADFCYYTVWGLKNKKYYLLHIWRKQGASYNEMVMKMVELNRKFRPAKIKVEINGFQEVIADLALKEGLRNIEKHTTTGSNKKNLNEGLPSLSVLFERGDIKVPRGDEKSREATDILLKEFSTIGYNPDKGTLESISSHDDGVMSTLFSISDLRDQAGLRMMMV